MALLDEKTRIKYLQELGYGSVRDFQLAVMYPKWVDGIYGPQTDNALRTAWNVHLYCKDFKTKEFMCECGGKYCGGYPDYMKPSELMHIQTIRDHYGRPITITSGLRCKGWNKHLNGSVENSGHLTGLALDFYQAGVTDTVANRKASMKYIRALPNHKFSYGAYMNGTDGIYRKASYMGNAMHTECSNTTPSTPDGKLNVDGVAGGCTIVRIQTVFGMSVKDGVISGQNKSLGKFYPSVIAVQYGKGGSATVKRLQKWAGATQDGIWGQGTSKALQHKLNSEGYNAGTEDGIFGTGSVIAFQKWLNDHDKPTADSDPQPSPSTNIFDKGVAWLTSIANDNSWHYVKYNSKDAKTKECPICHNHAVGKYHGWNCIGESFAFWKHGCGIPCKCANNVINNAIGDKLLTQSDADALATLRKKIGLNDIQVIRNGKSAIPQSWLKKGDICLQYKGNTYVHTFPYIGDGYTIDCGNYKDTNKQIAKRKAPACKVAIRYTGK